MQNSHLVLSYKDSLYFLRKLIPISKQKEKFIYNTTEKIFQYTSTNRRFHCKIKPPHLLLVSKLDPLSLMQSKDFLSEVPSYLILLIRAGHAVLGFSQNEVLTHHKVIKKYMVRKKQGKAQLTYQALRGKARGGAKLRLARTREFFEEINSKLSEWQDSINKAQWILFQCSPRLWGGLFKAKTNPPFIKADLRIHRIPLNTYKPTFKELQRINKQLLYSKIVVRAQEKIESIKELLSIILTDLSV
ncbi:MAG: hypothetical protein ACXADY_18595 [Candidatus Hodarchaeales archaeon]